jgi:hypothetical protein
VVRWLAGRTLTGAVLFVAGMSSSACATAAQGGELCVAHLRRPPEQAALALWKRERGEGSRVSQPNTRRGRS